MSQYLKSDLIKRPQTSLLEVKIDEIILSKILQTRDGFKLLKSMRRLKLNRVWQSEVRSWRNLSSQVSIILDNVDQSFRCRYRSFSLSRSKRINRNPFSGWSQEIVILWKINKDTSPSFRSVRSPKPQIFVEMLRRNLQSSVWKRHGAHQVHIRCAPIWRPENNVNIWNLRWLSRPLNICT